MIFDVSTAADLQAAISSAQAGDTIVLADGTYALTGVSCSTNGTEAMPITVKSANPLAAHIEFDALEGFKVSGAYWHFENLDVKGVCADDSACEHAFHVTGAADGFVLRDSRVHDFNAQLKVNAAMIDGTYVMPNRGLVEYNELFDSHGRNTSNPVTKLNIDTGNDWIVRGNFIHDAYKMGGDTVSYAAFMKSGGRRGLMERNLVVCSRDTTGGTRIGLSFGGGGTAPQFCAPAYDAGAPCNVEHDGGTMRNNIIANCSDVGIYLNRGKDSHILYNTIVAASGIDFRFDTTSGEAVGNVLTNVIRTRDGGMMTATSNLENVDIAKFQQWYRDPDRGDLAVVGNVSDLIGMGATRADVLNDYCGTIRPMTMISLGAIEHAVPSCETVPPPHADEPMGPGGPNPGDDEPPGTGDGGCCDSSGRAGSLPLALGVLVLLRRRRRRSLTPSLAVVLTACWTGPTPVQQTVEKVPEVHHVEKPQVYSGVLRLEGDNVVIEGDAKKVLSEPSNGVWIMLYGCTVRAHTRRGFIERLEIEPGDCMYREVGPIEVVHGTLVTETGAPGTRSAGSKTSYFDSDGDRYGVIGGQVPAEGQEVTVRARKLVANMAYAARSTERDIWFEPDE